MDSIFSLTEQQAPSTLYCLMLSLSVFSPLTQIWFIPTISIQSAFIKSFLFSSFISFHCTINSEFDLSFYQPGLIDLCWTIRLPQRRKWKKQPWVMWCWWMVHLWVWQCEFTEALVNFTTGFWLDSSQFCQKRIRDLVPGVKRVRVKFFHLWPPSSANH